jgi:hypothetical protein
MSTVHLGWIDFLGNRGIGDEGAKCISKALEVNTALTDLNLGCKSRLDSFSRQSDWR